MATANIADIVRTYGAERPDAPALEIDGRSVTFGELDRRSSQVAQALKTAGVGEGDRVAFIDKNGLEWFEVTFGLAKLGAVNVSVNWRLAPTEMAQIIDDAQAEVVVVGPEFVPHIEKVEGDLARVHTIVAIGDHARWQQYEPWVDAQPADDPGVSPGGVPSGRSRPSSCPTAGVRCGPGRPPGCAIVDDSWWP